MHRVTPARPATIEPCRRHGAHGQRCAQPSESPGRGTFAGAQTRRRAPGRSAKASPCWAPVSNRHLVTLNADPGIGETTSKRPQRWVSLAGDMIHCCAGRMANVVAVKAKPFGRPAAGLDRSETSYRSLSELSRFRSSQGLASALLAVAHRRYCLCYIGCRQQPYVCDC